MQCAPTNNQSHLRKAFTLLEMMMVMAIIAILVGGVIGLTKNFSGGARIQKAESEMQSLAAHLLQYKNLAGRFPSSEQGLNALVSKPSSAPKPRRWNQSLKSVPMDPWGNPYIYKMPGKDTSTYEIISLGNDGQAGGDDDISSQDDAQ